MNGRRCLWRAVRSILVAGILVGGLAACYSAPVIVGPVHSAIAPRAVMVFVPPDVPEHYIAVARLDPFDIGVGCRISGRFALMRLAREAGHLGANGILLIVRKIKPGARSNGLYCPGGPVVRAEAIYVPHWNPRLGHILKILVPRGGP